MTIDQGFLPPDELRARFAQAMSRLYRQEVPAYAQLLALTAEVNAAALAADPALRAELNDSGRFAHLAEERHGAIRVGSAAELALLARLFQLLGMEPVAYYDLTVAGLPVHSTAFRPVTPASLQQNAFRLFTSLLRLDLLEDPALREAALQLLDGREIVTPAARALIEQAEHDGGVTEAAADDFIAAVLPTFRWQPQARASAALYRQLQQVHSLVADVVCFQGPHINHLTPRTLDIEAVQVGMPRWGMQPKESIEGPPQRICPILLRQTSFKALEEPIAFPAANGGWLQGSHRARFGEVEQRGVALTARGRALYDALLAQARSRQAACEDSRQHDRLLHEVFADFPDNWTALREQELAWFEYRLTPLGEQAASQGMRVDTLVEALRQGLVAAHPILYEDFLPVSAAGIFRSNLDTGSSAAFVRSSNRAAFEASLGRPVHDENALYRAQQSQSIARCLAALQGSPGDWATP